MSTFQKYRSRLVEFNQLASVDGWAIKVYSITHRSSFQSDDVLENAVRQLPEWLAEAARLNLPTYYTAFLIVHEGRDGVWTLINWWIGGEMLQSETFFTSYDQPDNFSVVLKDGFMACVWELEVIGYEREMWIEHVLKKSEEPDLSGYWRAHISVAA
jgi:hypothetical protein